MAEFCKQCSEELFGEDYGDLAGMGGDEPLPDGHGYLALCEGCGSALVDKEGKCMAHYCSKAHGIPK